MSAYQQDYLFNNLGSLANDPEDTSQKTVYNTRFSNYMLANYFNSDQQAPVLFSTQQLAVSFNGMGLPAHSVDVDSALTFRNQTKERPWEKLESQPRTFASVPYLGRGSADPTLENMLRAGEFTIDRKSISTVSETSYMGYNIYPGDELNREPQADSALGFGWGGIDSRDLFFKQSTRPGGSR